MMKCYPRRVWRSLSLSEMSTNQRARVGAVAPPTVVAPVVAPPVLPVVQPTPGCGAYTPIVAPVAVPLYPPIIDRRRREREPAGISANIAPNQITSGIVLLAGTNFIEGDISLNGNSITVRRSGRYEVDVTINVAYAGAGSALFQTIPGYGTNIAGGTVTAAGTQVYSGSVVLELTRGASVTLTSVLAGAVITGGTISVQMIPGTGPRRDRFDEEFFF